MWIIQKDRKPKHHCHKPFNWFYHKFDIGSVWACDGCDKVYLYRRGRGRTYYESNNLEWFYLRERTAEDDKRFADARNWGNGG